MDSKFFSAEELEGLEKEKTFYRRIITNAFDVDEYLKISNLNNKIHLAIHQYRNFIKDKNGIKELEAILLTLMNSFQLPDVERTFNNVQLSEEIFGQFNSRFKDGNIILTNRGYNAVTRAMTIDVKAFTDFQVVLDYNSDAKDFIKISTVSEVDESQ
jgi:bacillopeptidase F (M6 metalloprotease family)